MESYSQYFYRNPGMKEHFYGNKVGNVSDKSRYNGNKKQPVTHNNIFWRAKNIKKR